MKINKQSSNSRHFKLTTLGVMLLLSACTDTKPLDTSNAMGIDTSVSPEESVANARFPGWHNPLLARAAEYAGQALIADLKSAQKALDLDDLNHANHYLNAAEDLAEGIQTMMPFSVTIDQIRDAKGDIERYADWFAADALLPVYHSLEELDIYAPELAQQSRDKVRRSEQLAKLGNSVQAIEILNQVETDLAKTTVYMPVISVSKHIDIALVALEQEPVNKINVQEQIDIALSSMLEETKTTSIARQIL